jgi:hypothetical protein
LEHVSTSEYDRPAGGGRDREGLYVAIALAVLAVLIVLCFAPLMGYFFSQDDFILMYRATYETGDLLESTFGQKPHHFRPLTKIFYFATMYRVFGLNPLPYHLISMLLHLANTLMVFLLLRRLRLSAPAAYVSAGLFGLNVAFFHAIAWISCVQQLAAALFLLLAMWYGIAAMEHGARRPQGLSIVFYVLALLSLEQVFLAPVFLLLIGFFGLAGRFETRRIVVKLLPHLLIMLFYAEMRLWWKGMPESGTSQFVYGKNILINLVMYAGALYEFWPKVGDLIPRVQYTVTRQLYVFGAVVVYNVARWRPGAVGFALVFIVGTCSNGKCAPV